MQFRGCGTALVTPFQQDGSIDETALRNLVAWQVESGIDFLVPCGTTGETPTLSHDEWLQVIGITVEVVAGTLSDRGRRDLELDPGRCRQSQGVSCAAPASMAFSRPRLTTTSRRRKDSTGTSAPSRRPWTSRSFSTTFRDGPARTSNPAPWRGWPRFRTSPESKKPAATSIRWPKSATSFPNTLRFCRAMMPSPCHLSRWVEWALFRWLRTKFRVKWRR